MIIYLEVTEHASSAPVTGVVPSTDYAAPILALPTVGSPSDLGWPKTEERGECSAEYPLPMLFIDVHDNIASRSYDKIYRPSRCQRSCQGN